MPIPKKVGFVEVCDGVGGIGGMHITGIVIMMYWVYIL